MKRNWSIFVSVLFGGFLLAMLACYSILPKRDFSENEKRYLAEPPRLDWKTLTSGDWGDGVENYLADHMPGRDFFVGLNAYYDLLSGRFQAGDIRIADDRLVEAPQTLNPNSLKKNMNAIHGFAAAVGQPVDLMIVPSAGWAAGNADYQDDAIISQIYEAAEDLKTVDLRPVFSGKPELYYRTDHHWTSEGAWNGYRAYLDSKGRDYVPADSFRKETVSGFRGSTYSRSALWLTPGEKLELWHGSEGITVTNGESDAVHSGVFYPERLEEADKYTVFLDGNHSLVRIHNPAGQGKLLVIRDSYSNCLGCFLGQSYADVVLADLRYYRSPLSELAEQEGFDDILICYSIGNFLTDANIVWLR